MLDSGFLSPPHSVMSHAKAFVQWKHCIVDTTGRTLVSVGNNLTDKIKDWKVIIKFHCMAIIFINIGP